MKKRTKWEAPKGGGAPLLTMPNIPRPLHGCLRGDAEVLTAQGWKRIDEVALTDRVACWDQDTEQIKWQFPTERIKKYAKQMVRISYEKYKTFGFFVTPDHRIPIRKKSDGRKQVNGVRKKGEQKWTLTETTAAKINLRQFQHFITAARNGAEPTSTLTNLERVYIAVQADGSFRKEIDGVRTYRLAFKKERKKKRFEELCNLAGVHFTKHNHGENSIATKAGYQRYDINLGVESKNFWNCFDITQFGQHKAREFIDEISVWDGSCQETCGILNPRYVTTSLPNAKFAQAISVIAGMTSSLQVRDNNKEKGWRTTYIIDFLDRDFRATQSCKKEVEEYEDYVYCINVPTHFFVVRDADTGSVMITGNCAPRTIMGTTAWNKMRKECYEEHEEICEICGAKLSGEKGSGLPLHQAHEVYAMDYSCYTTRFVRVCCICPSCHTFLHSGRAITCYRNYTPLWSKDFILRIAEHGFKLIDEWNRKHPDDEPLRVWMTIKKWLEEPSLKLEMQELVKEYNIKFWSADNAEGENGTWNKWKLIYDDTEYYSPYEDRAAYDAKMAENNNKPKNQPRNLFAGDEFERLRRNLKNATMQNATSVEST